MSSVFLLFLGLLRWALRVGNHWILPSLLLQHLSALLLPLGQQSGVDFLQLRQESAEEGAELGVEFYGIAVDGEGAKEQGGLQVLKFLERRDEVYVQIEVFELGEGQKVLRNRSQSVVRKIEPDQLLPSVGKDRLQCLWQPLKRGQLIIPQEQRSRLDFQLLQCFDGSLLGLLVDQLLQQLLLPALHLDRPHDVQTSLPLSQLLLRTQLRTQLGWLTLLSRWLRLTRHKGCKFRERANALEAEVQRRPVDLISSVTCRRTALLHFLQLNNIITTKMIESRVSQLLKQSRSRHSIVISPELRRASAQYQAVRKESRATRDDLRRLASEERYLEALNKRLQKGVQEKKRELMGAESVRARYQADLRRKERLEALKREELKKNQNLANRIKEERKRRINAVKKSIFEKQGRGEHTRWEKQKLREERWNTEQASLYQNRKRVEDIVEFQCNLKESYIRKKESMNSKLTSLYRHEIEEERRSIALKRSQTDQIKQKLKSLTQGTARRLAQMNELAKSIRKLKPSTPAARSIIGNPTKILQKSRCYTQTGSVYDSPHTDSSLFISNHEH